MKKIDDDDDEKMVYIRNCLLKEEQLFVCVQEEHEQSLLKLKIYVKNFGR
jgi:hypothetical protein